MVPLGWLNHLVKSFIRNAVKARRATVSNAEEMFRYCVKNFTKEGDDKNNHNRRVFFLVNNIKRDEKLLAKTVKGTRKLHCVETVSSLVIRTRNLSCFCQPCLSSSALKCENEMYVDPWVYIDLSTGKTVGQPHSSSKNSPDMPDQSLQPKEPVGLPEPPTLTMSRANDFSAIQGYLKVSESITNLKDRAELILQSGILEEYNIQDKWNAQSVLSLGSTIDKVAHELVPNDHQGHNRFPACIYGDGNCLPRCGSLLAFGDEGYWKEIRVRITLEMALFSEAYLEGDHIRHGTDMTITDLPKYRELLTLFSSAVLPGGKINQEVVKNAYDQITMESIKGGNYMGMWELFALSSVLGCPLTSIYPMVNSMTTRKVLNRMVHPREQRSLDVAAILWTHTSKTPATTAIWSPNHFVPLLRMTLDDSSCEVIEVSDDAAAGEQGYPGLDLESVLCGILF
jgi:hypothetical protein